MEQTKPDKKRCLIIAGGEFAPLPEGLSFDFCIACDRGFEYAKLLGIKPDLIIGDLDSANTLPPKDIPVLKLPAEKDDTDTMSAVKYALKEGFTSLTIACAFGGRFDHSLANVQTAVYVAGRGAGCRVLGKNTELYSLKNGTLRLPKKEHAYLSVFSMTQECTGVTLTGTKYPLKEATLDCFPVGVSNEWIAEEAVITVREGILAVVISEKD